MKGDAAVELWVKNLLKNMPAHVMQSVLKHKKRGTWISFAQNCGDGGVMLPRDWGGRQLHSEELQSWLCTWISTQYSKDAEPEQIWLASSIEDVWRQLLDQYIQPEKDVWAVYPLSPELLTLLKERTPNIIAIERDVPLEQLQQLYEVSAPACIVITGYTEQQWDQEGIIEQFIAPMNINLFVDLTTSLHLPTFKHRPSIYHIHSLQKLWFPDISISWVTGDISKIVEQQANAGLHRQGMVAAQRLHYMMSDPLFSWHTHTLQIGDIYRARYELMTTLLGAPVWTHCISDHNLIQQEGIYLWIPLQEQLRARHVLRAALLQGVDFWINDDWNKGESGKYDWIRLNYGAYPEAILKKGMGILQDVLGEFTARLY